MAITNETIQKYNGKSRSWLDVELWRLMSLWVRQSNADHRGIVKCVTCGGFRNWRYIDAGHFVSRRHMATKFHPKNVHPQCKECNGPQGGGEPQKMARYIDRKYGLGTAQELEYKAMKPFHMSRTDYIEMIEHYKQLLTQHKYQLK